MMAPSVAGNQAKRRSGRPERIIGGRSPSVMITPVRNHSPCAAATAGPVPIDPQRSGAVRNRPAKRREHTGGTDVSVVVEKLRSAGAIQPGPDLRGGADEHPPPPGSVCGGQLLDDLKDGDGVGFPAAHPRRQGEPEQAGGIDPGRQVGGCRRIGFGPRLPWARNRVQKQPPGPAPPPARLWYSSPLLALRAVSQRDQRPAYLARVWAGPASRRRATSPGRPPSQMPGCPPTARAIVRRGQRTEGNRGRLGWQQ